MVIDVISSQDAEPRIYLSHSQDPKKNPLDYNTKCYWVEQAFGDKVNVIKTPANNMYAVLQELYAEGFTDVYYVCGSDRADEAERIKNYNGKPDKKGNLLYKFNSINIVKAGNDRINEDDIQLEIVSASMQRKFVAENDLESFKMYCPEALDEDQRTELFYDVRKGMGLDEELITEGQSDIIGSIAIDSDKGVKTYSVYQNSPLGLMMGDDRFYNDWAQTHINKIVVNINGNEEEFDSDEITVSVADNKHVAFKAGRYKFKGAKGSGRSDNSFTDKQITAYQECIMGMILSDKIPNNNITDFLNNSITEDYKPSGVFSLGLKPHTSINNDFKAKWDSFVRSWGKALQVVYDSKSIFYNNLPVGWNRSDIERSTMMHPQYNDGRFINKKDIYDKADVYYCLDDSITRELSNCKNITDYCKLMEDAVISKKLLGVSLKRPEGSSIVCHYDIQGYTKESFSDESLIEYHYTKTDGRVKTVNLRFKGVGLDDTEHYPILEVRSDSDSGNDDKAHFAIQWRFNKSKAWAGKGKEAFKYLFGNQAYKEVVYAAVARNYIMCANIILRYLGLNISPDYKPDYDEHFEINDKIRHNLTNFMNISMGFNGRNDSGARITAPYIKVY